MTFEEVLTQALAMLQRQGRVSYRALKRQFGLDDDYLADLKAEIVEVHQVAVEQDGVILVWTGGASAASSMPLQTVPQADTRVEHPPPDAPLSDAPRTPDAARRQLTVLFCDLVDSTALSSQLDPEDYREVVRAYQEASAAVIQRFDGYIAQYLGDGLLVYFGYPQAHEDDAQRAVHTSLGIVEAIGALNARPESRHGVRLAVRLGIHTGLVVVGEMGGGNRQEQLALGETPNMAARLQGLAAPDTVLVSATTYRLIAGFFVCQDLGAHTLRGVAEPVPVYQILTASAAQSRLEVAGSSGLIPLVGREAEMTLLRERWTQSTAGQGQVVLLSGEAGIGKSRLVEMLRQHVVSAGTQQLVFRCSPYHTSSALYPVVGQVQRVLQWQRDETPATKLDTLEQVLQPYGFPLPEVVPLLAALLSIPLLDRYPPLTLTPQRQRQQTLETLVAWCLVAAERQPVLAVWEDLHWADPSTLELLGLILDQAPTARMLTLLTCRPEFHPPWATRSYLTQLTLGRLSRPQVEAMITHHTGGKVLPAEVVTQIVTKTDGVPLFVEELVKMILESGLVHEEAERYVLTGPLPPLAIPTTLQDSLMARLDRLGPARDLAQLAAVLGREFTYEVLRAVTPLDEVAVQQTLTQLVDAEVLYQRGLPPRARYVFKHALIQEAAYQSLLRRTRQQYHLQIAHVLETQFPETAETQPEFLARHYTEAGLYEQALAYWQRAGDRALGRSAYREAVGIFEQALSALSHLPETRATREQAIDLRLALRNALQPSGDAQSRQRILVLLREAEALAVALDDSRRLGRICVHLTQHFFYRGLHGQVIATSQRAVAYGAASGDSVVQALANQFLGSSYHSQGDYRRASDCLGQTVGALVGAQRYERFGQSTPPAVLSRTFLVLCHAELGTFAAGRALGEEGLQIAEALAHPYSLSWACHGLGLLCLRQGDLSRALPLLERAVGVCRDADLPANFPRMAAALGAAYTLAGRLADAVLLLTQAREQSAATGRAHQETLCSLPLGEAYVLASRLEEAQALAERALALAREPQERGHEAYALRLLGEIAAHGNPPDGTAAATHYQQALTLATALGMRPLVAHCHLGLGTLYVKTSQEEQARATLSAAVELYRAMEMTCWLPQAEAALAQVGNTE
jgi:class 3 adenylate cyclase/tetratricopeptide (TPR) repeat protein